MHCLAWLTRGRGDQSHPSAAPVCPGYFLIMFCRRGLIRDVRVIIVQGGCPCTGALGLPLFAVFLLGEWIHQYSDGSLLRGYRVTGEIQRGEDGLKLKSNTRRLCVICELSPFCWAQHMTVWILMSFKIWWAWLTFWSSFSIFRQTASKMVILCTRCGKKSVYSPFLHRLSRSNFQKNGMM